MFDQLQEHLDQPYCRCCGKPIPKLTISHRFGVPTPRSTSWAVEHSEPATSKAEAQRHVNGQIVSVRYGYQGQVTASVWDGASFYGYGGADFCTIRCAAEFGRMAADFDPHLLTAQAAKAQAKRDGRS